ncbi:GEN endonuclease, partial [Paradoxornis webbianus]|nr:GEN endonuclease [Sinosuthora webbiana]
MGVTYLWQILEPVRQAVNLSSLRGKTLAVDLSLWVCEAQTVKKMVGVVTKPHLRNLFFRFSFFTSMGIKLVFVMEGEAPRLKADTMSKRNEMRYGPSKKSGAVRTGRSLFKAMLKECLELLECLGVPWVQAAGEAEAMCAYLNAKGLVDGCITNDGDAFLYGAETVYRNFAMNAKDPHLDSYTMSSIKEKLGCDRESLIGLAVLLGCDYLPKGVPGVGKEQALKLIETLRGQNLLQRFEQWKEQFQHDDNPPLVVKRGIHCSECHHPGSYKEHEHNGCKFCGSVRCCKPSDSKHCCPCAWHRWERAKQANAVEDSIRKKAKSCEGFPFSEVIQEFLVNKDKLISIKECRRPNLLSFQLFASEKMEWTKHYACKKLLALLTRYDMIQRKSGYMDSKQLQAIRIVKTRVKNGIPCFEIEWQKPEHYVDPEDEPVGLFVVTVEEESLFQAAYPDVVALYQVEKSGVLQKKQKKKKDRPEEKELPNAYDEVTSLLSQISLKPTYRMYVQHSMSDTKAPPEDQTQQRIAGSKNVALPLASCKTAVHMSASAAALAGPSVPSHCTEYSGITSSSSVPAGLQLSSADGKGTFFSTSPAHGSDDCDPAADLTTGIKHSHPLSHETVGNSSEYSDVTQSDVHSDSEDDLFSNDAVGQLQDWSLSQRILKKAPISSQPLSEDVVPLESLNCFKQTKETLNPDRNHVSSSCQLNDLVQESKNVLSENSASESSVHIYQDACKKADTLAEMVQKDPYISDSASLAFSGQTTKTLHPGCEMLPASQKPAGATGCHIKKACIETTWKASFKKSVCQNRCSSSDDSDDGHMDKILICEQQKRQLNTGQFKKCITKKRSSVVTSKRTNSDSALIKEKKKTIDLKKAVDSFSMQVSVKSSSVEEVNCSQSPEQPIGRLGSDPTQQNKSDVLTYVWADSPLPLSERLKRRIKIN